MNAEALIGTVLGTSVLQQLIGEGSVASVFLAQQAQPPRQVAVKVLLPRSLPPNQQAALLERFHREVGAVASLEHPNIMPVYEYGNHQGLAYLVMPYIGDTVQRTPTTLHTLLEREGPLAPSKIVSYLEQLAAALDFAHARGILHLNIKPANILITPQGHLLLTDFGLGRLLLEGQEGYHHLTRRDPRGRPWTLDYMAPEQVQGELVNERADLYSLGVILYQMVTGTKPFQNVTPMRIAAQHTPPSPPHTLRPDLPLAAEQVILRALAKYPADRYASGQDLVTAFSRALTGQIDTPQLAAASPNSTTNTRLSRSRSLFDPTWQTGTMPSPPAAASTYQSIDTHSASAKSAPQVNGSQTSLLQPAPDTNDIVAVSNQSTKSTMKLTDAVTVVRVPIAGQPGQYVTGLLPRLSEPLRAQEPPLPMRAKQPEKRQILKIGALIMAVVLIVLGTGTFFFYNNHSQIVRTQPVPNTLAQATAMAQARATATANIILSDPLSQNIHNWLVSTQGPRIYVFQNGAYHITDNDSKQIAPAILPDLPNQILSHPFGYTLTMQEIKGNDTSASNSFGMLVRFSQHNQQGRAITTFYSFEIANAQNGEYQFWRYDNSQGSGFTPWKKIWSRSFNHEFHQGHARNTFKVFVDGSKFTFTVNSKQVGTTKDNAITSGEVGMLVNLKGTEVAFSNLELTYN